MIFFSTVSLIFGPEILQLQRESLKHRHEKVKSRKYCFETGEQGGSVFEESNNEGDERLSINLCELLQRLRAGFTKSRQC